LLGRPRLCFLLRQMAMAVHGTFWRFFLLAMCFPNLLTERPGPFRCCAVYVISLHSPCSTFSLPDMSFGCAKNRFSFSGLFLWPACGPAAPLARLLETFQASFFFRPSAFFYAFFGPWRCFSLLTSFPDRFPSPLSFFFCFSPQSLTT